MLFLILSELCTPLTNWFWNQPFRYTFSIEPFSQKAQLCGGFIRQMGYRPQMAGENNSLQAPVQKLKTDLKHLQCGSKESLEKKKHVISIPILRIFWPPRPFFNPSRPAGLGPILVSQQPFGGIMASSCRPKTVAGLTPQIKNPHTLETNIYQDYSRFTSLRIKQLC